MPDPVQASATVVEVTEIRAVTGEEYRLEVRRLGGNSFDAYCYKLYNDTWKRVSSEAWATGPSQAATAAQALTRLRDLLLS